MKALHKQTLTFLPRTITNYFLTCGMMEARFTESSIENFLWFESSIVNLGRSISESANSDSVASRLLSGSPGSDPVRHVLFATTRFLRRSASATLVNVAHGRLGRMKWSESECRRCFSVGGWGTLKCSLRSSFFRISRVCRLRSFCWSMRSRACWLRSFWVCWLGSSGG